MSVIVKGMKMPESCDVCPFSSWSNLHQTAACKMMEYEPCFNDFSREYQQTRSDICPLVELPEKHGRLIDADAATKASVCRTGKRLLAIDTAPTVIEAEGEG